MTLSHSESQTVRQAIELYLDDPERIDLTTDLAVLARKFDALPVYADIGAALLVRCNGEVVHVHSNQVWDENSEWEIEADPEWQRVAYLKGAVQHPIARDALLKLVPGIPG